MPWSTGSPAGACRPLHRGVYALGHARLRAEGRWLAAVLACGPGAVLSHRSAAAIHDLHCSRPLRDRTAPPRRAPPRAGRPPAALRPARARGRHRPQQRAPRRRHPHCRISAAAQLTRSDLEGILLEAARARGLTLITDHPIHLPHGGEITVDYYVPAARLVIEADSWKHHRSRASFEPTVSATSN